MTVLFAILALTASGREAGDRPAILRFGGDPAPGLLVNVSAGARPFDPIDPTLPTVVFVHGVNLAPRLVHFEMAERLAEALARRGGSGFNVLAWDWNAATIRGLSSRANNDHAIGQGRTLALALRAAGVEPSRTHLIGHSSGGIVAASAARSFAIEGPRPVAQLTLLEPAACYHDVVFGQLAAGTTAPIVENFWAPGPSGYGREVAAPGVRNVSVGGPTPLLGVVWPLRSDHLAIVRWYIQTAADPTTPVGFNSSLLLRQGP